MVHKVTPDELVYRLRRARWVRSIQKEMEHYQKPILKLRPGQYNACKQYIKPSFNYINQYILMNAIVRLPPSYEHDEDKICCLLNDLATFELTSVLNRLRKEGAIIDM